jgi:hypothetical protein
MFVLAARVPGPPGRAARGPARRDSRMVDGGSCPGAGQPGRPGAGQQAVATVLGGPAAPRPRANPRARAAAAAEPSGPGVTTQVLSPGWVKVRATRIDCPSLSRHGQVVTVVVGNEPARPGSELRWPQVESLSALAGMLLDSMIAPTTLYTLKTIFELYIIIITSWLDQPEGAA